MKDRLLLEYLTSALSSDMNSSHLSVPSFTEERRPKEIWKQKVFCVLSSQFNAQRAAAIANHIVQEIPFFEAALPFHKIEETCFQFLSSRQIGYRFPKVRAHQISQCWFLFCQIRDEYQEYVRSFGSDDQARDRITKTFPGIGLKQASMFLRNIGASKNLCVIDVHVLFYLKVCHGWEVDQLTPKRYLQAEDILRSDACHYGLELNVFDTVVWSAARALKRANTYV